MNINEIRARFYPAPSNQSATSKNGVESFAEQMQTRSASSTPVGNDFKKDLKIKRPDDETLVSQANATGLSYHIKYAESSTQENPVVVAIGTDENGMPFEKTIHINDIDPHNATVIELKALEAHLNGGRGGLSRLTSLTWDMGLNDKRNFIDALETKVSEQVRLGEVLTAQYFSDAMNKLISFWEGLQ